MFFKDLLHCGLEIYNWNGSKIGSQFIVGIDYEKNVFNIFSEKNPGRYKFYDLPFDYLNFIGEWSDDSTVKLVRHRKGTIQKKLDSYNYYLNLYSENS